MAADENPIDLDQSDEQDVESALIDLEKLAEILVEKLRFELMIENERTGRG